MLTNVRVRARSRERAVDCVTKQTERETVTVQHYTTLLR